MPRALGSSSRSSGWPEKRAGGPCPSLPLPRGLLPAEGIPGLGASGCVVTGPLSIASSPACLHLATCGLGEFPRFSSLYLLLGQVGTPGADASVTVSTVRSIVCVPDEMMAQSRKRWGAFFAPGPLISLWPCGLGLETACRVSPGL